MGRPFPKGTRGCVERPGVGGPSQAVRSPPRTLSPEGLAVRLPFPHLLRTEDGGDAWIGPPTPGRRSSRLGTVQEARSAPVAERGGFEPPVPFGTHAFQACTFNHSVTAPRAGLTAARRRLG